jgi:hypothetical protein
VRPPSALVLDELRARVDDEHHARSAAPHTA